MSVPTAQHYIAPSVLAACSVDPERDAVVPFAVQTTSTTAKFATMITVTLEVADNQLAPNYLSTSLGLGTDQSIEYAADFSNGPTCAPLSQPPYSSSDASAYLDIGESLPNAAPHSTSLLIGAIVFHGYYSPAHPDGTPQVLGGLWFFEPHGGCASNPDTPSVVGPAVVRKAFTNAGGCTVNGWYFPMDGVSKPATGAFSE
jgi:hypothetical protein